MTSGLWRHHRDTRAGYPGRVEFDDRDDPPARAASEDVMSHDPYLDVIAGRGQVAVSANEAPSHGASVIDRAE
jgi:hypothetical protein